MPKPFVSLPDQSVLRGLDVLSVSLGGHGLEGPVRNILLLLALLLLGSASAEYGVGSLGPTPTLSPLRVGGNA